MAGNQTLDKTTLNALRVCSVAGIRDVPVAAGAPAPLLRELITAPEIHGESGLDGPRFAPPTVKAVDVHAVDLIVDLVMGSGEGELTLVPTGPLTNIALAARREPRIVKRVREVVLMGGSYTRGNHTPAAEFNILVDPEAAAIVFGASWPVTMVGLDLTHQALAVPAVVDGITAIGTPLAETVVQILDSYTAAYRRARSPLPYAAIHDPCAVARVIRSELLECVPAFVAIETQGRWTAGMTVTDFSEGTRDRWNAQVATKLDADGFWALMTEAIRTIGVPGSE